MKQARPIKHFQFRVNGKIFSKENSSLKLIQFQSTLALSILFNKKYTLTEFWVVYGFTTVRNSRAKI